MQNHKYLQKLKKYVKPIESSTVKEMVKQILIKIIIEKDSEILSLIAVWVMFIYL